MAFDIDSSSFDEVFGKQNYTREFIEKLRVYLYRKRNTSPFREMYLTVVGDRQFSVFRCRTDCVGSMIESLSVERVPFILVRSRSGRIGFITRKSDDPGVTEIIDTVLHQKAHTVAVLTGNEMRAKAPSSIERDLLAISGLSKTEMMLLRNRLGNELSIDSVGVDTFRDGTYRLSLYGKDGVRALEEAYLGMQFLLAGKNARGAEESIRKQIEFEQAQSNAFSSRGLSDRGTVYMIGDNHEFVKLNAEGFSFGYVEKTNGENRFRTEVAKKKNSRNYHSLLMSYTNRLSSPVIAYDIHQAMDAIQNRLDVFEDGSTRLTAGEQKLAETVTKVVSMHQLDDPVMSQQGKYNEKFEHFTKDAGLVIEGAITGKIPRGYSADEILQVQNVALEFGVNLPEYAELAKNIRGIEMSRSFETGAISVDLDKYAHSLLEQSKSAERVEPVSRDEIERTGSDD